MTILVVATVSGCTKNESASQESDDRPPMQVSVLTLEAVRVPISAEAVAQTEGAKEVEIRPRVGGIL
ncbi:MAG TPA: efflux transporter periplasmic adaptor subunit, partial [Methylotenera sp.]|nr:efflux transporter periplasmic adaptor subunit [Methylotenera sp.]